MADPYRPESGWEAFSGPNAGYLVELYDRYAENPDGVDPDWREWFERHGPPPSLTRPSPTASGSAVASDQVADLAESIRRYGHLAARVNPIQPPRPDQPWLDPGYFGLKPGDLERMPAGAVRSLADFGGTAAQAIERLKAFYTGPIAFEFHHVTDPAEHEWLRHYVEDGPDPALSTEEARWLLHRLTLVDHFEQYLHRTFPGQKRFSIEGADVLVPMLDKILERAATQTAIRNVVMGMGHRGRLNVLAHVLKKPYRAIFSEFHNAPNKDVTPSEGSMGINQGWTGDVKYHLGATQTLEEPNAVKMWIRLANNPSHLEFVNPVVEGMTRALQDTRSHSGTARPDPDGALPVLVHGDAAFSGEGIVAETFNLSGLDAYTTGGTLHIIVNNQLGFTTEPQSGRSTPYASDLAKGYTIPIVHVNAEEPEWCVWAATMAMDYRRKFHKDFLIDLVCFRRHGHNEGDDPRITQPLQYEVIDRHPSAAVLYGDRLVDKGVLTREEREVMTADADEAMTARREEEAKPAVDKSVDRTDAEPAELSPVSADALGAIFEAIMHRPRDFSVYPRLERVFSRWREAMDQGRGIDWGLAESLALGTILAEGIPIRLAGQDSQRGTFGQRHAVLHDAKTGETYCPLQHLPGAKASATFVNSPLSEAGAMGFEYGYSVEAPGALVLWEAQYGDFANVAQPIVDLFLASGRAKWKQNAGLVLLLPHGYEGQGPEHSSARLERYLELSAENNWRVAYPSTAAQYFHLLRSQAARCQTDPRPLVVMTPKSLLRHPGAVSDLDDLSRGRFSPVLEDLPASEHGRIRRLVLCTGKIGVELSVRAHQGDTFPDWLGLVRIERLYPFPARELSEILGRFPDLEEVVWAQEEPENMGAGEFVTRAIEPLLPEGVRFWTAGRRRRSSPAEGFSEVHTREQARILDRALLPAERQAGDEKEGE